MQKELFEIGKTVDAAIDSACEKLGCLREDCEWEIIDLPKKGFLGLKNIPAKVRVSIEVLDEKPAKVERPAQPEARRDTKPQAARQNNRQPERPKAEGGDKNTRDKQVPFQPRPVKRSEPLKPEEISEKEAAAKDYIASILEASGLNAEFEVKHEHGGSYINIIGEGLGAVIGRRGETLDALQYLAGLVANRAKGDYLRLTVDCGDYRIKRKGTLEALAKKLANQVLKTNVSRTLEPMNPFERRIIHATVSEIEGVSSSSVGEEPNRRVVITSPTAKPPARGGYRNERGDRDSSRGSYNRGRGPRADAAPRSEAPLRSGAGQAENGERGAYNRDNRRDGRDGGRDARRDGGRPRQATPTPQGPPRQTPETEHAAGLSFGKIEL